jgi:hypothetical protein
VAVAWLVPNGEIQVARRPAGGGWTEPETVVEPWHGSGAPSIAMNAAGDLAVAWSQSSSGQYSGQEHAHVSVSKAGKPFGAPQAIEPPRPYGPGGIDVAVTPAGDAVAVWATSPDQGTSRVLAATRTADGVVTPVQTLADSATEKTCPQVVANALGQVAALWHEVDFNCFEWGGDVMALRPPGQVLFSAPAMLPGAQDNATRGTLGLADDGTITVAYSNHSGGQLISGSFGVRWPSSTSSSPGAIHPRSPAPPTARRCSPTRGTPPRRTGATHAPTRPPRPPCAPIAPPSTTCIWTPRATVTAQRRSARTATS